MNPSRFCRAVAVVGLVGSSALLVVSVVLQPVIEGAGASVLARLDAAGWRAVVSAAGFTLAQLPYVAAVLGIGHLLRDRAPRLGAWGALLSVVGAFGHTVFGGISLVYVVMAQDAAHRSVFGGLVDDMQSSPVMVFSVLGLAGFVFGLLLLSIGLLRAHVGPLWLGPALWVFLVVEFVGTSVSEWASYVSSTLLLVVFVTLAREALTAWDTEPAAADEPAVV